MFVVTFTGEFRSEQFAQGDVALGLPDVARAARTRGIAAAGGQEASRSREPQYFAPAAWTAAGVQSRPAVQKSSEEIFEVDKQ